MKNFGLKKIKIFADGADIAGMVEMASKEYIKGLTTNPTLMRKAGITNYEKFAKQVLYEITEKPVSFEVFTDDLNEMKIQGEKIASWAENVYVKIPITNTQGISTSSVIEHLSNLDIKVNITAIMTTAQVHQAVNSTKFGVPNYISVFAGRIADTGLDPIGVIKDSIDILKKNEESELIWASPRELLNLFQADQVGCNIITATNDILKKLELIGYDLNAYSLDTVKMFYEDAQKSGFKL